VAIEERDPHTGYLTTGHEWNGIKELNSPVPRIIYLFLAATALFSLVYWVLMPAWPLGVTYTRGLLGIDQTTSVQRTLQEAALDRQAWTTAIADGSFDTIKADPALMAIVRQSGRTLFGDNCAACHGTAAGGGPGYPALTTASYLWGSDPEAIAETIRVGINSSHPETRISQMLAFGHDQILPREDIDNVVDFVRSLSAADPAAIASPEKLAAGATIFADTCAACHGEDGRGNIDVGAPDLADAAWIYGGDRKAIFASVWDGRQGHMPTWEERLPLVDRKILTLYLDDLRSGAP